MAKFKYPTFWREMVKHGLQCSDEYAELLLDYEPLISNGIDTSEASWEELDEHWAFIHQYYQEQLKGNI